MPSSPVKIVDCDDAKLRGTVLTEEPEAIYKLVALDHSEAGLDQIAKRRHDLRASLRTVRLAIRAIATGYRFDDDRAPKHVEALTAALDILASEADLLDKIYSVD